MLVWNTDNELFLDPLPLAPSTDSLCRDSRDDRLLMLMTVSSFPRKQAVPSLCILIWQGLLYHFSLQQFFEIRVSFTDKVGIVLFRLTRSHSNFAGFWQNSWRLSRCKELLTGLWWATGVPHIALKKVHRAEVLDGPHLQYFHSWLACRYRLSDLWGSFLTKCAFNLSWASSSCFVVSRLPLLLWCGSSSCWIWEGFISPSFPVTLIRGPFAHHAESGAGDSAASCFTPGAGASSVGAVTTRSQHGGAKKTPCW